MFSQNIKNKATTIKRHLGQPRLTFSLLSSSSLAVLARISWSHSDSVNQMQTMIAAINQNGYYQKKKHVFCIKNVSIKWHL